MPRDVPLFALTTNPLAVETAERERVDAVQRGLLLPWQSDHRGTPWFAGEQFGPGVVASSRRPPDFVQFRRMLVDFQPEHLSRIDGTTALTAIVRATLYHLTHLVDAVAFQQRDLVARLVASTRAQGITREHVHAEMTRSYQRWPDRAPDLPLTPTLPILRQLDDGLCVRNSADNPEEALFLQASRLPGNSAEWLRAASEVSEALNFKNLADLEQTLLNLATTIVVTAENERAVMMITGYLEQIVPAVHLVQEILDGNHHPEARGILDQVAQYRTAAIRSQGVITQYRDMPKLSADYTQLLRNQRHTIGATLIPAMSILLAATAHIGTLENAIVHMEDHVVKSAQDLAVRAQQPLTMDAGSALLRIPATRAEIPEHWDDNGPLLMLA